MTAPAIDCSLIHTSQRCTAEDALVVAGIFATGAAAVMDSDWAAGLRLGPEANVLYARQSTRQTPQMRYDIGDRSPSWARTLLLCSQVCERHDLPDLALDSASWMGGVLNALTPFAFVDTDIRSSARVPHLARRTPEQVRRHRGRTQRRPGIARHRQHPVIATVARSRPRSPNGGGPPADRNHLVNARTLPPPGQ